MQNRTPHQDRIIRRYYANQDTIMVQKLSELVADLYLATGKSRASLWKRAAAALTNLKIPASQIEHLVKSDNPALLAKLVQELFGKASS